MRNIAIALLFTTLAAHSGEDDGTWTPVFNFQLEDSSHIETLIWISGNSYAYSEISRIKNSPYCLPESGNIGSEVILEILNTRFKNENINSEQASSAIVAGIREKFPCK
jgi:hypothetical protein